MSQKQLTPSRSIDVIREQVRMNTPDAIIELIARQLDRANDAAERIEREGAVVRDMRGSVIPHPAVAIELTATKAVADLLSKHKK